jgi:hypothetical protein
MNESNYITDGIYLIKDFMHDSDKILDELKNLELGNLTINNKILSKPGRFEGDNRYKLIDENNNRYKYDPSKYCKEWLDCIPEIHNPWLRCPSIENQIIHNFSDPINKISKKIKQMGYIINIAKIQKYTDGSIIINPHSDKIIDLDENTPIFICRFGSTRKCILIHKLNKTEIIVDMPHNSILILTYSANKEWKHGILKENKCDTSYSIVLRNSITFKYGNYIYGKNTPFKTFTDLQNYLNNQDVNKYWSIDKQRNHMVKCFSIENKTPSDICLYDEIINNTIYPY